jgi:hypothetical protein
MAYSEEKLIKHLLVSEHSEQHALSIQTLLAVNFGELY